MKKISKSKIVSTYALALYKAADEKKAVERVWKDIDALQSALGADSLAYLANPVWNVKSKQDAIKEIGAKLKLSSETINCLDIIADNNRFAELSAILEGFKHLYYQKHGIEEVEVQTSKALSAAQDKQLKANLEKMLAKKVLVNYVVRPEILGGLIIKYGSSMIDDSIQGKLNRLEIMMKGGL